MMKRVIKGMCSAALHAYDLSARLARRLAFQPEPGQCVAFYYHGVSEENRGRFAAQLDYIQARATFLGLDQERPLAPGRRYAAVTFDDALVSFLRHGYPELERRQIPVAVFVPTAFIGRNPGWGAEGFRIEASDPVMSLEELRELARKPGVSIGSHTARHASLVQCAEAEARRELQESKAVLETALGLPVRMVSFPYGAFSERELRLARELGYTVWVTTRPDPMVSVVAAGEVGRVGADPRDSMLELYLKLAGAYRWQSWIRPVGDLLWNRRLKRPHPAPAGPKHA